MKTHFFDIESLDSVFTMALFKPEIPAIDLYMIDDLELIFEGDSPNPKDPTILPRLKDYVKKSNRGIYDVDTADFTLHNILSKEGWEHYAHTFSCTYKSYAPNDDLSALSQDYRIVADTDSEYDPEKHPYFMGYNSYNYDTTMMAIVAEGLLRRESARRKGQTPPPLTAKSLRENNDNLFNPAIKGSMPTYLTLKPVPKSKKHSANSISNITANPLYADYETKRSTTGEVSFVQDFSTPLHLLRKGMLTTGRYVDVARLNEKQQHVQLKRLLGMLGHQILESDRLDTQNSHIENLDDLFELIAYNASDVINLYHLFSHPVYKSQFELKKNMLDTYPELVYETSVKTITDEDGNEHPALDVDKKRVRSNRLYADSSSQQLTSRALCPVGHLYDNRTVSFDYPSKAKAEEIGLPEPYNVLKTCIEFFETEVLSRIKDPDEREAVKKLSQDVFGYYQDIQGRNFNTSTKHTDKMYYDGELRDTSDEGDDYHNWSLSAIPTRQNCIPYYDAEGKPTSCFVTFSTGGIHGAEYNKRLYDWDMEQYKIFEANMLAAQAACDGNPVALRNMTNPGTAPIPIEFPDGKPHYLKEFLKSGFTKKKAAWKPLAKPALFQAKRKNNNTELNKRYVYTSASLVNHEDFSSYYPNLLRALGAFVNELLGTDRYGEIYLDKEEFGKLMKDKSLSDVQRLIYSLKRNGVKLILNTASGAGDATFDNPIRMNNKIISMRIIGQLFSWRIGQSQALEGARVPSTNTDGLYTILDAELNEEVLQREAKRIDVKIESEPMYLISKDSNNRIEYTEDPDTPGAFKILAAGGGSLACYDGPDPSKSLNHPAIMDHVLAQYLMGVVSYAGENGLLLPYKPSIGMNIIRQYINQHINTREDKVKLLLMFQNVIAASTSSITYHFATPTGSHILDDADEQYKTSYPLRHINRVFIFDESKESEHSLPTVHIRAASAKIITDAVVKNRAKNDLRPVQDDPLALRILQENGTEPPQFRNAEKGKTREAVIAKINGVDPDWHMHICNKSLHELDESELDLIIENLDLNSYNALIEATYNKNWRNALPQELWPGDIQNIYSNWFGDVECSMEFETEEEID